MRIAFIGLGNMGQAMARNLARAGHQLTVYNRTRSRAEALSSEGVRIAETPAEAVQEAEVLITMLADDQAVETILWGESNADRSQGLIHELQPGLIHISMSTISVALSKRLKQAHESAGQVFIAAPVFGRPEAAAAAKLSIVAAGPADSIEKCRPLFDALGQNLFILGEEQPNANLVKLTGNFMIASMLETLGEAYALVGKAGIEPTQFLEIVNGALFKSPIYQNYGTIIAEQKFDPPGFKLRLGLKDVRLALAAADTLEVPMQVAAVIHDNFLSEVARGRGDADWAALGRVAAERAGLGQKG
jgi:3-hydroxyisobutyrate dehydrogenase-like beta-hydroxyacid dehydrogenase